MSLEHYSFDLSPNTTCVVVFTRVVGGGCIGTARVTSNGVTSDRALIMTRGETFDAMRKRALDWATLITGPLSRNSERMAVPHGQPVSGRTTPSANAETDFGAMRRPMDGAVRKTA